MVGILSLEEIDALLTEQRFARLGCHADGKTYVVPISFVLDGNRLVGQTTPGLKIDMMRKNPEVCVQVDDVKDLTNWRSAIVWGRYEELTGVQAASAMGTLIDRYGAVFEEMATTARLGREMIPPRPDHMPSKAIVYCIRIKEKTGRFEKAAG